MSGAQGFESNAERPPPWSGVALLDLFASTVQLNASAVAFADTGLKPGGARRRLTYAQASEVLDRLRQRLDDLALPRKAVVLIALGTSVEAPLCVLATLKAGLLPCLVPAATQQDDIAAIIAASGAQAAIACGALGDVRPVERVRAAAALAGGLRYVLGFGERLPAGVIDLAEVFSENREAAMREPPAPVRAATLSVMTVEVGPGAPAVFVHDQESLVSLALELVLRTGMASGDTVFSTLSPMTQVGLAVGMAPLLIGGSLLLQPLFSSDVLLDAIASARRPHLVAPAALEEPLAEAGLLGGSALASTILLHRPPVRFGPAVQRRSVREPVVDLLALGERATLMSRRGADGRPALTLGEARVPEEDGALVLACRQDPSLRLSVSGACVASRLNETRPDRDTDWSPTPFAVSLDRDGQIETLIRFNSPLEAHRTPVA